jgi:hypothetical protein
MGAFDHTGFLGNAVRGKALESLVCATAASGFLLFGYDRKSIGIQWIFHAWLMDIHRGCDVRHHH